MANRIFRSASRTPRTITDKTLSSPLLPGTAVFIHQYNMTQANAVSGGRLALLGDRDYMGLSAYAFTNQDPLTIPYVSGENGVAYLLKPGHEVQWAMAAGTYASGQELTVAAGGRLAAAVAGNTVVAHYDQPGATVPAGFLADVCIGNFYTKP